MGELIHNSHVINELEELGIHTVDELPENETGICIIRSHGASPEVIKNVTEKGFEIVDLTCPDVKKVQQKAIELAKENYLVIIVGKPEHPEVVAIKANAKQFDEDVYVIPDINSLKEIEPLVKEKKRVGVVVQTTQRIEVLNEILKYLTTILSEFLITAVVFLLIFKQKWDFLRLQLYLLYFMPAVNSAVRAIRFRAVCTVLVHQL